ncbi:MAG TPA: tetratricopeptide repeat protein [Pyrinomonadaceae bacterium]|nr:tetratricopeptide repeat protein [Pyrinomonadaceae bacterium]
MKTNNSKNPFPGLRPFNSSETHLFFGRDGQSTELLKRLKRNRFLAVVGTSGSGKSSLVRAGLLPALQGGMMASAGSDWRIAIFRPGNAPIDNLAQALMSPEVFGSGDKGNYDLECVTAETSLRRSSLGLAELAQHARMSVNKDGQPIFPDDANLLVVVDQFEELFRFKQISEEKARVRQLADGELSREEEKPPAAGPDVQGYAARDGEPSGRQGDNFKEDAAAFVKLLLEAARHKKENIYVVLTMRSDYLGDCSQFWDLPEAINSGQYLIPRMTRDERREAITGPVGVRRAEITEPLINQLLNDAGDNPDQLPILQHALMRTWNYWHASRKNGGALDLAHYNEIGGMERALSQHADEAYESLSKPHQAVAEKLFKALTEKGDDNREIRRPMPLGELCEVIQEDIKDVKDVIGVFRESGRSFLLPADKPLVEDSLIDISHESLIRGWERLAKWVNEEARSSVIYKRLAETALLYPEKEGPLRDPALQVALEWLKTAKPNKAWAQRYHPAFEKAIDFLAESEKARAREAKDREEQLQEQLAQAKALADTTQKAIIAEQQRAQAQARSARMFFWFTIALGALLTGAIVLSVYALRRRSEAITAKAAIAESLDKAQAAEKTAREAEERAEGERQNAVDAQVAAELERQKALDAKKVADTERDKANQREKQARDALGKAEREHRRAEYEVKLAGFYQKTLDATAQNQRTEAAGHLGAALTLIKQTEKEKGVPRQINVLRSIGDIYTGSGQEPTDEEKVKAVASYDELAVIHRQHHDVPEEIKWWEKSAQVYESVKDANKAADYYTNKVLPIYTKLGDTPKIAATFVKIGDIHKDSKRLEEMKKAVESYEKAAAAYHASSDFANESDTYLKIGKIYLEPGNRDERLAEDALSRAVTVYDEKDKASIAAALVKVGDIYKFSKDKDDKAISLDVYAAAAETYEELGDKNALGNTYVSAALAAKQLDSDAQVIFYYTKAVEAYRAANNGKEEAQTLRQFASSFRRSASAEMRMLAIEKYEASAEISLRLGDTSNAIISYKEAGEIYTSFEDEPTRLKAADAYNKAANLFNQPGETGEQSALIVRIGDLYRESKAPEQQAKADDYYQRAARVYLDDKDLAKAANTFITIGNKYRHSEPPNPQKAAAYFSRAAQVYHDVQRREDEAETLIKVGRYYQVSDAAEERSTAKDYYERAVRVHHDAQDRENEADLLIEVGKLYQNSKLADDKASAQAYYDRALGVYGDDPAGLSKTFIKVGQAYETSSNKAESQKASAFYDKAVQVHRGAGNLAGQSSTLIEIGKLYEDDDDKEKNKLAVKYFDQAVKVHTDANDPVGAAAILIKLGDSYLYSEEKERKERALSYYEAALRIYESPANPAGQATVHKKAGLMLASMKQTARALEQLETARRLYAGDHIGQGDTLFEIGKIYKNSENVADQNKGEASFKEAVQVYMNAKDLVGAAALLHNLGDWYDESPEDSLIQKAAESYEKEAEIHRTLGRYADEAAALIRVGETYNELATEDFYRKAAGNFARARALYKQEGELGGEGLAAHRLGLAYKLMEENEEALRYYNEALLLLTTPETRRQRAEVLASMAVAYISLEKKDKALESYNQAYDLYQALAEYRRATQIASRIRRLRVPPVER